MDYKTLKAGTINADGFNRYAAAYLRALERGDEYVELEMGGKQFYIPTNLISSKAAKEEGARRPSLTDVCTRPDGVRLLSLKDSGDLGLFVQHVIAYEPLLAETLGFRSQWPEIPLD